MFEPTPHITKIYVPEDGPLAMIVLFIGQGGSIKELIISSETLFIATTTLKPWDKLTVMLSPQYENKLVCVYDLYDREWTRAKNQGANGPLKVFT